MATAKMNGFPYFPAAALVIFSLASSALAQQGPFANVMAGAECLVDGQDVVVTASLTQKEKLGPGPHVGTVTFALEEHVPKGNKFDPIAGSAQMVDVNTQFPPLAAGDMVDVAVVDYMNICSLPINADANSIRVVVTVEVFNANPTRGGAGLNHVGRCTSFSNPCQ